MVLKNAIIIKGVTYKVVRKTFVAGMEDVCTGCDLRRRCDKDENVFCAPFEKHGFLPYFKKVGARNKR